MRILYFTLKAHWYDMIEAGIKPEEYREIKPYWIKRFLDFSGYPKEAPDDLKNIAEDIYYDFQRGHSFATCLPAYHVKMKEFDAVCFARGGHFHHSIKQMTWQCKGINVGTGNSEWGAEPGKDYFVTKLGERIK